MASELGRHKAAQAWCTDKTSHKVMDPDLAEAFAEIIDDVLNTHPFPIEIPITNEPFKRDLEALIKKNGVDVMSKTQDFILCQFLMSCLDAYNKAVQQRDAWDNCGREYDNE